jgi:uncharacterized protein (UPF0332 family)
MEWSKDLARIYNDLFERRQEGDYIDFVSFGESQVLPWISKPRNRDEANSPVLPPI